MDARGASRSPSDGMRAKSVRFASRDSRTIQRIGRDAGNSVAQTERGAFRSSSLGDKLHPCQSIASRLAIARGICARFSALGGRLALSMRGTFAAPSAFVVEFELWLSSGWVGSHRVAYSRLESGGQADYDKYAADLPRSLGSG